MKTKSFHLAVIIVLLLISTSCKKNLTAEYAVAPAGTTEAALVSLGSGFSRAFGINNSGVITGSVRNTNGKVVAFMLKNNRRHYFSEEVSPNGIPEIRFAINDPGEIAGSRMNGTGITPVLWKNGQAYDLQTLPGQQYGEVFSINNAGVMVGESLNGNYVTPTSIRATVFSLSGPPIDLGTLGGSKASALGVNEQGHIVGFADNAAGQSHAFLYKDGVMRDLGTLGGTFSNANGINNRGEVVGRSALPNNEIRGFLYKEGIMQSIPTLGGNSSVALSINDKGDIVGFARISNGDTHAFLYSNGVMQDLGTLGGVSSRAHYINNRGDVVGQYVKADGSTHGFLYRNGEMFPL